MAPVMKSVKPGVQGPSGVPQRGVYVAGLCLALLAAYSLLSAAPFGGGGSGPAGAETLGEAPWRGHRKRGGAGAAATQGKEASAEQHWFARLSPEGCEASEYLRVCAHRASSTELDGVASGSIAAYSALWTSGIRCYDVNGVATADGEALAAHPDDLAAAARRLAMPDPERAASAGTLQQLRAAGLDEERFPTVQEVVAAFASMLAAGGQLWSRQEQPDYARLPVLLLTLKGGALRPDVLQRLVEAAGGAKATRHVALFVATPQEAAAAQAAGFAGPLIFGFRDADDPSPPVSAQQLALYAMLGPSILMSDSFFKAASALGKPIHAWTVDTSEHLHRALQLRLDSVISNTPLAINKVLSDWRDRCSDKAG